MTWPGTAPGRRAALVALYGAVPGSPLAAHLLAVQARLSAALGVTYVPRSPETLHTTLIGLDQDGPLPVGHELDTLRRSPTIDLAGVCAHLAESLAAAPLVLQYGGFADRDLPVTSRGRRPYDRSLVDSRQQVVAVGWPVEDGRPTLRLDRLRRELVALGAQHRYPLTGGAADPDAHLVVGEVDPDNVHELGPVLEECRRWLSGHRAQVVVGPDQVSLVVYDDPRLPPSSTAQIPLADLLESRPGRS